MPSQAGYWILEGDDRNKSLDDEFFVDMNARLGQPGNYGFAVKGRDRKTGEVVAIKVIQKRRFERDPEAVAQFRDEINIMRKLKHPAIIEYKAVFEDRHHLFIVMEMCPGGEVFDLIQSQQKLTERTASHLMRQLFEAVQHMHKHKILHRDIKPDNVLIKSLDNPELPHVKLIDFGLSKYVRRRTYLNKLAGTPFYIAPEVHRGQYNESADIWSLGVIMFVMCFGYPPFHAAAGEPDSVIRLKVLRGFNPVVKPGWGAHFPAAIRVSDSAKHLMSHLLKADPAQRLSAEEALNHPWIKGQSAPITPLDPLVLDSLKSFCGQQKFKQAILQIMTKSFSGMENSLIERTFRALDKNGDGKVSAAELTEAMRHIRTAGNPSVFDLASDHVEASKQAAVAVPADHSKIKGEAKGEGEEQKVGDSEVDPLSDEDAKAAYSILQNVDLDGDGFLSIDELMIAYADRKLRAREERMDAAFRLLDKNNDGAISMEELEDALRSHQNVLPEDTIKKILHAADKNGDGIIDYTEFMDAIWMEHQHLVEDMEQAHLKEVEAQNKNDE